MTTRSGKQFQSAAAAGTPRARTDADRGNVTMEEAYVHPELSFVYSDGARATYRVQDEDIALRDNVDLVDDEGNAFRPFRTITHAADANMLHLSKTNDAKIYMEDVERGSVVQSWTPKKDGVDIPVGMLTPVSKYAQMTDSPVVEGASKSGLMQFDLRQKQPLVRSMFYARAPKFTCMATTRQGYVATGAADGKIRLFGVMEKHFASERPRAVTEFPGLGDAIVNIAVSNEGDYVLAVCPEYLLVYPTRFGEDDEKLAFVNAMPNDQKPVPYKLQMSDEDKQKYSIENCLFTHASFDECNKDSYLEQAILAYTSNLVIRWDFKKVVDPAHSCYVEYSGNSCYHYTVHEYEDDVVAAKFMYGQERLEYVTTTTTHNLQT